jgi:hypothetical protein
LLAHELVKKGVGKQKIAFALCRVGNIELTEAQNYITEAGQGVLKGSIPEKIAYRRASDEGRALTRHAFPRSTSGRTGWSKASLTSFPPSRGLRNGKSPATEA